MKYLGFVALCTLLPLSACGSPQAQESANQARCASFGVPPGSPGFAVCMIRLAELDALEGSLRAQRMQAVGAALSAAGASLNASRPTTLNCTSIKTGQITNTTCD